MDVAGEGFLPVVAHLHGAAGVERVALGEPFDRDHLVPVCLRAQHQARADELAVEEDGARAALAEASRTVGSPQIRNRGTIGGNLGTASPAGDALPPLLVEHARVEIASVRGVRTLPVEEFLLGVKRNALEPDELVTAVRLDPSGSSQTFMKVGPRNAMVIAICSLAVAVDPEAGEVRAAFGSAAVTATRVIVPLGDAASLPERVAEAASPIDDVRATAAYRRHALRVLAGRALERCLPG